MSQAAPLFAALVDALASAAPSFSIPIDANRVYQMQPDANGQKPYVVVHLPADTSFWDSKWIGSGQRQDTHFKAQVTAVCGITQGIAHLLGDGTTPGPLNINEDVVNAVENARGAFLAAAPQLIDVTITGGASWKADGWIMTTTFIIDFWTRGAAGSR